MILMCFFLLYPAHSEPFQIEIGPLLPLSFQQGSYIPYKNEDYLESVFVSFLLL
jgi:hypothetical protein